MQVQKAFVVQPHGSVNFVLLMVKATVLEIVPEHVKAEKLNAHQNENVNITSCRKHRYIAEYGYYHTVNHFAVGNLLFWQSLRISECIPDTIVF